jgi:hypothetical protein
MPEAPTIDSAECATARATFAVGRNVNMLLQPPWSRVVERVRFAAVALLVLLLPAAAQGALRADVNGDGVLDTIRLEPSRSALSSSVALEISGRPTAYFAPSEEPLLSIAVADIDHDGHNDVVAAAPHRGLFFWRNLGDGHFAPHQHLHAIHPAGPPLIGSAQTAGTTDDPQTARADDDFTNPDDAAIAVEAILPSASTVSRLYTRDQRGTSRYVDRNRSSRAPPSHSPLF